MALSEDVVHKYSDAILSKLNKTIGELRRVFLVEDLVDSIKVRADHGPDDGVEKNLLKNGQKFRNLS